MTTKPKTKQVPTPTPTTQPYWDGTAKGELWIQRCVSTGRYFSYPRRFSPYVVNGEVKWVRASGKGRLYSYVINHVAAPGYADEVPYVIAIIQLEEGPRVMANLLNVDPTPEALELDMPVQAVFEERGDLSIVQFVPAESVTAKGE